MRCSRIFLLVCACELASASGVRAQSVPPRTRDDGPARAVPVGPVTSVPVGWVDFCARYIGECDIGAGFGTGFDLDARTRDRIQRVNTWVNQTIQPVSDPEAWGVADRWDYPDTGKGDCEDFSLLKRRLLIAEGLPAGTLLVTVVKDAKKEGHAVLTVRTTRGDFILDNLNDEMKPWDQTGYRFVKRQSHSHPNLWVQLGEPPPSPEFVSR